MPRQTRPRRRRRCCRAPPHRHAVGGATRRWLRPRSLSHPLPPSPQDPPARPHMPTGRWVIGAGGGRVGGRGPARWGAVTVTAPRHPSRRPVGGGGLPTGAPPSPPPPSVPAFEATPTRTFLDRPPPLSLPSSRCYGGASSPALSTGEGCGYCLRRPPVFALAAWWSRRQPLTRCWWCRRRRLPSTRTRRPRHLLPRSPQCVTSLPLPPTLLPPGAGSSFAACCGLQPPTPTFPLPF